MGVLCDVDAKKLESARDAIGDNGRTVCVDVTDLKAVESAISQLIKQIGPIDILVNSAGITGITNVKSHEVDPANVDLVFRVNFFGSFNTARAVLPGMLRQNYGRILHIASIAGKEGNAGMMAYSASKAAVIGMTKVQGKELAETGITVNALAPAVIRTILNGDTMQDWNTNDMIFDVPSLIEFLSGSTTLLPGTVILTGTPHGVGMAKKPPLWLKPGDKWGEMI